MAVTQSARTHQRHKTARAILWVAITLLAFALRAAPIASAWPYIRYVDEGHVVHHAIDLLQAKTIDNGFYNYPALPSYLIAAAISAYAPFYSHKHQRDFWSDLQRDKEMARYYDYVSPPQVLIVARSVVLFFSVGVVIVAGVLASFLGGKRAGLLALLVTALCPALVSRGSIVIVDTIAAFFATAALCFAQRLHLHLVNERASAWRFAAAAGFASGLAFDSKYMAGAVFAAVATTILLTRSDVRTKTHLLITSTVALVIGAVLCMPALALHPANVFHTIAAIAGYYDRISYGTSYWRDAFSPRELGLPLVLASVVGVALLIQRSRATRVVALSWLAFALVLFIAVGRSSFQPFRNLLPLVPALCVGAAFLLARGDLWFAKAEVRRVVNYWIEPAAALVVLLSLAVPTWREVERQRTTVDSRAAAMNWLRDNTSKTDRIVALRELAIHPAEWRRIGRKPVLMSWPAPNEPIPQDGFDYLLSSDFSLQFAPDQNAWSEQNERWTNETSRLSTRAEFGMIACFLEPGVWRTNDERIRILQGSTGLPQ